MATYGRAFGAGLLVGAAAGALLGVAERYGRRSAHQLIDWDWAVRVAVRTCGTVPPLTPAARASLEAQYRGVLEQIEAPIAAYTRTHLPLQGTAVQVLDRPAWIRTNARNFQELLQPFEAFYRDRAEQERIGAAGQGIGRLALSSQLGVLLGYLGRRVLGQYDISLLGREPVDAGKLYFVEPNIQALETSLGLPPAEIRTWIALHEATHAHEFELHPWVRRYLNTTLQQYLSTMVDELAETRGKAPLGSLAERLVNNLRSGHNLITSFMTAEQRELVSRLQALMALLEGYSNHIMHQVGRGLLPHFAEIEARIEARQKQRSPIELWFLRVTGLSMKMEQYALGEAFVGHVVSARGVDFLNRVWDGPESLPTEAELRAPGTWVTRVDAAA
jgi:coenzyme F420 biosynthesis associated uncharacterized protein